MAERLRHLTRITSARNQIPSGSVGSNPTNCENFLILIHTVLNISVVDSYWFETEDLCLRNRPVKASD